MRVVITAAVSVDGLIARSPNHLATEWTSKEDTAFMVRMSKELGVVVMGARTFATLNRGLKGRRVIVYSDNPPDEIPDGVEFTTLPPVELITQLSDEGVTGVTVWGGSSIYTQFLQAGVVDDIYLTVEPVLFGSGVRLCDGDIDITLRLLEVSHLNEQTLLLHYVVV